MSKRCQKFVKLNTGKPGTDATLPNFGSKNSGTSRLSLNLSILPPRCHPERGSWFAKRISYGVEGSLHCHLSSERCKAFSA